MRMEVNEKLLTEEELHSAFDLLRKLTPEHELSQFAPLGRAAACYTTLVTLWMLTLQRDWSGGLSLTAAVKLVSRIRRKHLLPDSSNVRPRGNPFQEFGSL